MADVNQARYAYPKFKVFIFGVDVSADVTNVNVTSHDGEAPNTCQITLINELDKYLITTADMIALQRGRIKLANNQLDIPWLKNTRTDSVDTSRANSPSTPIGTSTFATSINAAFEAGSINRIKKDILLKKHEVVQNLDKKDMVDILNRPLASSRFNNYFGAAIKRYPLTDGAPIFHSMDPVRVFMRDPFNPGRWYHHFCGFISDMADHAGPNNDKTLTLVVEDPTKLFRYSRVFVNPGIIDANVVIQKQDFQLQSFYASPLKGMTLPEIFFTLIFGPDRTGATKILESMRGANATSNVATRIEGIGHFSFDASGIFSFGPEPEQPAPESKEQKKENPQTRLLEVKPETRIESLEQWQAMIDHEVQPSDIYVMAADEVRDSNGQMLIDRGNNIYNAQGIEGIVDEIGSHPELYLVDGGRLMLLMPRSLGVDNRQIVIDDIIQTYPLNSEWHSAGTVLFETVDRIQFVMYCSPRGDIIIEPPLYDYDPSSFGTRPISSNEFLDNLPTVGGDSNGLNSAVAIVRIGESKIPGGSRGPFGTNYIILKRDTYRWEQAFIDEKVHNVAVAPSSIFQNYENLPNTSIIGDLAVVKIPHLIPLYGVRQVPLTPRGYIATKEGALLFCHIALNKLNADAHTIKVDHVANIKLWLNRPLYIQGRNLLATTKQISHTLTWGGAGDMGSSTDLYAARPWDGTMSKENPSMPLYSPIGSFAARPLDYSILFGQKDVPDIQDTGSSNETTSDALSRTSSAANAVVQDLKKKGSI